MYKTRASLKILFDISSFWLIDQILKEMERCPRYPDNIILRDHGYVLVLVDAFEDYLQFRQVIREGGIEAVKKPFKVDKLRYLNAVE